MPSDMNLAAVSLDLVYAAMVTLTLSMVLFAVSFAAGRGRGAAPLDVRAAVPVPAGAAVAAGAGAGVRPGLAGAPPDGSPAGGTGGAAAGAGTAAGTGAPAGRRSGNVAMSLAWLGLALLLAAAVARGVWAGRVPWGNMYEFSLSTAVAVLGVFLAASVRRDLRWLGVFIVSPVLLILGLAITVLYTETAELVPALKSYWLVIHVAAAVICAGAFTLGAALSLLYLLRARAERRGLRPGGFAVRLPSADRLDALAYRVHAFVFPLWTFAVIAGAIWAENAWGRYWGWDPKETWAFITWVVYAGYLHARATAGWKGSRAAWIAVVAYGTFVFNYFAVNLIFNGLHSYSGV